MERTCRALGIFLATVLVSLAGSLTPRVGHAQTVVTQAEIETVLANVKSSLPTLDAEVKAARALTDRVEQAGRLQKARDSIDDLSKPLEKASVLLFVARIQGRVSEQRLNTLEAERLLLRTMVRELRLGATSTTAQKYDDYAQVRETLEYWERDMDDTCRELEWANQKKVRERGGSQPVVLVAEDETWDARLRWELRHLDVPDKKAPFGDAYPNGPYGLGAAQRQNLQWESYTRRGGRYKEYNDALRRFGRIIERKRGAPSAEDLAYFVYLDRIRSYFIEDTSDLRPLRSLLPKVVALRWKVQLRIDDAEGQLARRDLPSQEKQRLQARIQELKTLKVEADLLDFESYDKPELQQGGLCWALLARWPIEIRLPEPGAGGAYVVPLDPKYKLESSQLADLHEKYRRRLVDLIERERQIP